MTIDTLNRELKRYDKKLRAVRRGEWVHIERVTPGQIFAIAKTPPNKLGKHILTHLQKMDSVANKNWVDDRDRAEFKEIEKRDKDGEAKIQHLAEEARDRSMIACGLQVGGFHER